MFIDSIERLNSELQKYYQASKDKQQNSQEILSKKLTTMSAAFVYLVPKIRDLVGNSIIRKFPFNKGSELWQRCAITLLTLCSLIPRSYAILL